MAGRSILLVGGGQSAAESVLDLLSGRTGMPRRLTWATGAAGLAPLDDSPFSNEWFNPRFVEYFRQLPTEQRASLLNRQSGAGRGVARELLARIYRRLYDLDYLSDNKLEHELLVGATLTELAEGPAGLTAVLQDTVTGVTRGINTDIIVLATGYRPQLPEFMAPLNHRMAIADGAYKVGSDYRASWDGPEANRIYVQNTAQRSHGIADAHLGLAAWRSAVILNSLLGREHYSLGKDDIALSLDYESGLQSGSVDL